MNEDLAYIKWQYETGRHTWSGAVDAVATLLKISKTAAEEIVGEWDNGEWGY
jgi:hypothetical protein